MASPMRSPTELDELAKVDPEIGAGLKHMPPSRAADLKPEEFIKQMRAGFDAIEPPSPVPSVREQQAIYTTRDQTSLRMLVYKPAAATAPLPLFVWYHGGGGCLGRPEMNAELCRDIALKQQCVVIAPQYRLAPEHKYPTGIQDSWDALEHIATHGQEYGADPTTGLVIAGESAGAVIASLLSLQARDKHLNPPVTGVFLSAGSYMSPETVTEQYHAYYRSRTDEVCLASPMLSKASKAAFDACLQPDMSSPDYRVAHSSNVQAGLPRTYLQTCGMDINRDDGFIYRHMLHESGVETKLDVYPGCPHCFWFMFPDTAQGRKWKKDTQDGVRWLLAK
ncbi:hypothetical protein LTR36_006110 [Oleoguttula mirabilis]|uniref:Alpha/beta hydrolase fold-3 domain-containing protein n=1 Tax=Oleoguttula mirabilis TaxID=1507867 RepID=A0AAV9JCX4_9PEZI|nr:hypothetical protein LTR36_006110 [Oleoguttula mirabilis]